MAKTTKKKSLSEESITIREAMKTFDLAAYRKALKKFYPLHYAEFIKLSHDRQMMHLCHAIVTRPDMQTTLAYKKALKWLRDHNTRGGMF